MWNWLQWFHKEIIYFQLNSRHIAGYGLMETSKIVAALSALAQETRLGIFRLLVTAGTDGMSAGAIAKELDVVASTLSHHLGLLEQAELVHSTRSGRHVIYSSNPEGVRTLVRFLNEGFEEHKAPLGCAAE